MGEAPAENVEKEAHEIDEDEEDMIFRTQVLEDILSSSETGESQLNVGEQEASEEIVSEKKGDDTEQRPEVGFFFILFF